MNRVYIKIDRGNVVRFNWPDEPVGKWDTCICKWPVCSSNAAIQLIEWLFDGNGYTDVLYSQDWEFIVIEEDHDN